MAVSIARRAMTTTNETRVEATMVASLRMIRTDEDARAKVATVAGAR